MGRCAAGLESIPGTGPPDHAPAGALLGWGMHRNPTPAEFQVSRFPVEKFPRHTRRSRRPDAGRYESWGVTHWTAAGEPVATRRRGASCPESPRAPLSDAPGGRDGGGYGVPWNFPQRARGAHSRVTGGASAGALAVVVCRTRASTKGFPPHTPRDCSPPVPRP